MNQSRIGEERGNAYLKIPTEHCREDGSKRVIRLQMHEGRIQLTDREEIGDGGARMKVRPVGEGSLKEG